MVATRQNFPLLEELLAEQQRLDTPVARFAVAHEAGAAATALLAAPQLIPLTAPQPGEQYAFEVDLDSCTGCKSCVAACHSLNGLDETETWRDVGLLISPSVRRPFTQTVTTACHHCADPACLNGCPVLAYEKDPATGIVTHLDDQCIGCSYCVLKCPYDVPKFSTRLGIVRKCDMCHGRLAAGESPACAQACPTQAIRIVTVKAGIASTQFLAAAPSPEYTCPTTRYVSARPLPENLVAADLSILRPQPAHWPLVIMLTLLPLAVGLACAAAWLSRSAPPSVTYYVTLSSGLIGMIGLAASAFHLGQPLRAWRIFLGWRKSWLSREAMVFGAWIGVAALATIWPPLVDLSAAVGLLGLGCSAMIYVDTRRQYWRAAQVFPRFFGTAALATLACCAPRWAGVLLLAKLTWESCSYFERSTSARLQRGPLSAATLLRDGTALLAVILFITSPGWPAIALALVGEFTERYLFFRAVDAPKMPGMAA